MIFFFRRPICFGGTIFVLTSFLLLNGNTLIGRVSAVDDSKTTHPIKNSLSASFPLPMVHPPPEKKGGSAAAPKEIDQPGKKCGEVVGYEGAALMKTKEILEKKGEMIEVLTKSLFEALPVNLLVNNEVAGGHEQKVDAIRAISTFIDKAAEIAPEIYHSDFPDSLIKPSQDALEGASRLMLQVADFMSAISDHQESKKNDEELLLPSPPHQQNNGGELLGGPSTSDDVATQFQRRASEGEPFYSNSSGKPQPNEKSQKHRRTFSTDGPTDSDFSFRHLYDSQPQHRHLFDMQHAMWQGDEKNLRKVMRPFKRRLDRHLSQKTDFHQQFRRRAKFTDDNDSGDSPKVVQCKLLANCASRMSLYDLFVWFKSDDIDGDTGEISEKEDITEYDEEDNLVGIFERIKNLADAAIDNPSDANCDNLLIEYHRQIEFEDNTVIHWEGAMVNQVCLAEGTTIYVDFASIERASSKAVATAIFGELVVCAVNLFNERPMDDRYRDESNPFIDENGSIRLAKAFNLDKDGRGPRNEHGQLLTNQKKNDIEAFEFDLIPFSSFKDVGNVFDGNVECPNSVAGTDGAITEKKCKANIGKFYNDILLQSLLSGETSIEYPQISIAGRILDSGCTPLPVPTCTRWAFSLEVKGSIPFGITAPQCGCGESKDWFKDLRALLDGPYKCSDEGPCEYYSIADGSNVFEEFTTADFGMALNLVFGDKPSIGFICGITEAVVNEGKELPGYCCLDAPYQLDGDQWGREYQCEVENEAGVFGPNDDCKQYGPYFAGIDEAVCDANGGTFCGVANCTELLDCITEYIECAVDENRTAYATYLKTAPNITNPSDPYQCGRTREYFGFDENFINDDQICVDVKQYFNSRQFGFLDEFLGQGTRPGGPGGKDGLVPPLLLTKPTTKRANVATDPLSTEVGNNLAWQSTNFALQQVAEIVKFNREATGGADECPCDPSCISTTICILAKVLVKNILGIVLFAIEKGLEISEFTRGQLAELDNIDPIDNVKRVEVIYENMDRTGDWMQARFQSLNNFLAGIESRITKQVTPVPRGMGEMMMSMLNPNATNGGGCDDLDQDGDGVNDNCEEDMFPPMVNIPAFVEGKTVVCDVALCIEKNFQTKGDAVEFLDSFLLPTDDCADEAFVAMDIQLIDDLCQETIFEISALQTFPEDSNCSDTTLRGPPIRVKVGLDDVSPVVTCGFLGVTARRGNRLSADGRTLVIPDDKSPTFIDTSLYFDIQENCPGDVQVEVAVQANEFVRGTEIAFVTGVENIGSVAQATLFVTPQSCAEDSQDSAIICKPDPMTPFRFYEITVSAIDSAGNKGVEVCRVIVDPSLKQKNKGKGKGTPPPPIPIADLLATAFGSSVRYNLASQQLNWKNHLAPSEIPSNAPSVSSQPSVSAVPTVPSPAPTRGKGGKK